MSGIIPENSRLDLADFLSIADNDCRTAGVLIVMVAPTTEVKSSAPCPENRFCVGPVRPDCEGLKKEQLCRKCYLAAAMQEKKP